MDCKISCESWLVIFASLLAILLRVSTSLHPHSGEATPPMYGDYEAQRHWMEVTTNLPLEEWYFNTTDNNLDYWGLDYPPLTAYHMYLCGLIAHSINENFTKLHDSRGYETDVHKLFMRVSVLFGDIFLFIPALIWFYETNLKVYKSQDEEIKRKKQKNQKNNSVKPIKASLSTVLALFYPGIILIDHGHFQYNCISLGLAVLSITCLLREKNVLSTLFFCLALNYKQMELYHALPFFFYLLSTCVPKPGQSCLYGIFRLLKIGLTVIITFAVIWWPFLVDSSVLLQVLHRQFPIARGVFEDKVANIWCAFNILFKFKTRFNNYQMLRICLFSTLAALFPSCCDLFLHPNKKKFILALINSSLVFFLFSFQVHEKSILLVAIPVLLYFPNDPFVCFWFLYMSVFSMLPLFIKDNLTIAFIALVGFYFVIFRVSIEHAYQSSLNTQDGITEFYKSLMHAILNIEYKKTTQYKIAKITVNQIIENSEIIKSFILHVTMLVSIFWSFILIVITLTFKPPKQYPDLFPLLISVYSCVHFLGFFLYFTLKQLKIPQQFEDIKNVKVKSI